MNLQNFSYFGIIENIKKIAYERGKSDAIKNICRDLTTELDLLNASDMSDVNLYNFAVKIKLMADQLREQENDSQNSNGS